MLEESAKVFLRYCFVDQPNEEKDNILETAIKTGITIEELIKVFSDQFASEFEKFQSTDQNIKANMKEACQYVAGLMGLT